MTNDQPAGDRFRLAFESVSDAHEWVDDWVVGHQPLQTSTELAARDQEHLVAFEQEFGRLCAFFDVSYDILVALVDEVNYLDKSTWPPHRTLQFMLLSHNLKAFVSAMDRLGKGYYEDSISLARGPYETFARLMFMSCNQDHPYDAVFPKTPPGTPSFDLTGFLRDQLRLDWAPIYSTMSIFAHSNVLAMIRSLDRNEKREGSPEIFGLTFEDDETTKGVAAVFLPFLLLAYTRFVLERLIGGSELRDPTLLQSAKESIAWLEVSVSHGDQRLWRRVVDDLDYLFVLLAGADGGSDWKSLRASRPTVEVRKVSFDSGDDH